MDITTITVAQFKAQFPRDFPYFSAIQYDASAVYNIGDRVYYATTRLFYDALIDGVTGVTPGTDATKWVKAVDSVDNYVQDDDITRAFAEADIAFNQSLFGTDAQITLGFLYLAAHFLCNDLKAAFGGVNGTGAFPMSGRSVGSVSESYSIPIAYSENPIFAMYTQTSYGMKYLMLILPRLTGNVVAVDGGTHP